ncbi:EamA family transporter [Oxobacter pfennigii]|uniref:EamA family transporter n=1 Tax=Oxobacter pfennigii TaxID=36849 RepID=UPI0006D3D282
MNKYFIAFLSIFFGAVAQLFLKKGSDVFSKLSLNSFTILFTNKYILTGLFLYGASALLWINVLSKMKLSAAYPLVSFGYVLTFILSYIFLHENISMYQVAGLLLIISGIIVISL